MLELRDASVIYPGRDGADGVEAVRATSLTFERGSLTVLLGPSGAGKSSLLRTLNGLVPLTRGTVSFDDEGEIRGAAGWRRHRRRTAMVFQHHQLIGRLAVLRNVMIGRLGYHSTWRSLWPLPAEDKRIALAALERVGLEDFALRRVDSLSGGQQQRVGIARALAQAPEIVLADEPVASLDPATAGRVLDLLRGICREDGITAVVSLHQVERARDFADRIVGISDGAVVFDGTPGQLTDGHLRRIYGSAPAAPADRALTDQPPPEEPADQDLKLLMEM